MNPQNNSVLPRAEWALPDEEATRALGQALAQLICRPKTSADSSGQDAGARIHLRGELGSGKTSLARAFLRAAGVRGRIKSPSYALLESYNVSNLYFHHLDFYRFTDAEEWRDTGFQEIMGPDAIVLIEWPEQAGTRLPAPDLDILLVYEGQGRRAYLTACSEKGQRWLKHLIPSPP